MIQPGLERIGRLLQNVQFPWKAIHVAGTNGKGSICGNASNLLSRRLIPNGRFTSPHMVDRWDCIQIDSKPVGEREFRKVEDHFIQLNEREQINASEFELLTATAFQLFNDKNIDVGVIEVGMGGKLDATNILENQVVSVISKIAQDHEGFLGNTIEEIALHKAGILRPNVPYMVNPVNELKVHRVIDEYAETIGAGPRILLDTPDLRDKLYSTKAWHKFAEGLLPFQRDNAVLAYLAYLEVLSSMGLNTAKAIKLLPGIKNKQPIPGRLQLFKCPVVFGAFSKRKVLIDGAHNPDAAKALRGYLKRHYVYKKDYKDATPPSKSITYVLAMTEGKDARQYLGTLLVPGDKVITTSFGPVDGMPWVKSMDPKILLQVAKETVPGITGISIPTRGTYRALCAAKYLAHSSQIVLTGSLYLVGDFLRDHQATDFSESISRIDKEEKYRVGALLSGSARDVEDDAFLSGSARDVEDEAFLSGSARPTHEGSTGKQDNPVVMQGGEDEARRLQEEIEQLEREMRYLQTEDSTQDLQFQDEEDPAHDTYNVPRQNSFKIRKFASY